MDSTEFSRLFSPQSIVLIGASGDPHKLSGRPLKYLQNHGYPGDIYLVNPRRSEIDGRKCYDSVLDIPDPIDLALVLVPARITPSVVRECGEAGVPFSSVIASGFSEMGDSGNALEAELLEAARKSGTRIVGPNSEGIVNVPDRIGASFSSILKRDDLLPGRVSFLTQSGAFGGALFQLTQNHGVGAGKWLSTGNESDLTTIDFIEYLVEDPETDVIATYIEALSNGHRLRRIAKRAVETETDIVAIRVGRSRRGKQATASHTGSIATDDVIYDSLFAEAGVTRVHSVDEFIDTVTAMAMTPAAEYPTSRPGIGLGVVSISGGAAALIADSCEQFGLQLANFSPETESSIETKIPDYGAARNPVDVTGAAISQPEIFESSLRLIANDESVTAMLLQFGNSGPVTLQACRDVLFDLQEQVPIATVFTGGIPTDAAQRELIDGGVHYFEDPVRAVRMFGKLTTRANGRNRIESLPTTISRNSGRAIPSDWPGLAEVLDEMDIRTCPTASVSTGKDAVESANRIGYPVVLKYSPTAIDHKSEVEGVFTGLTDEGAVVDAYTRLSTNADAPIIIQKMIDGVEVIVGIMDDPDFGPTLMVGPGGTYVELFDDFAYSGLPTTGGLAREMIESTILNDLLAGYRDQTAGDVESLCSMIVGATTMYEQFDLTELEFNPVIVTENGAYAVDLLVR